MTTAVQLILEFLRIVLSWPSVVLCLGVIFFIRFKEPISALLNRIASIKLPGGGEVQLPQARMNALVETNRDMPTPAAAQAGDPGAIGTAHHRAISEKERAHLWEYRYLNYFLVARTQAVLDWLANRAPTTVGTYDSWLMPFVTEPLERTAMLNALQNHHLVHIDGDLITVTEKGREYLAWRGPLNQFLGTKIGPPTVPMPAVTASSAAAVPSPSPMPEARPPENPSAAVTLPPRDRTDSTS